MFKEVEFVVVSVMYSGRLNPNRQQDIAFEVLKLLFLFRIEKNFPRPIIMWETSLIIILMKKFHLINHMEGLSIEYSH